MEYAKEVAEASAKYTNDKSNENFRALMALGDKIKEEKGIDFYVKLVTSNQYIETRNNLLE